MVGLAKSLLVGIFSAVGVGGITTAFYASPVTNLYKTLWKKNLKVSEPIMECDDIGYKYEVFMRLVEAGETELGTGITLEVIRSKEEDGTKKPVQIPWGKKATQENDWMNLNLTWSGNGKYGIYFQDVGTRGYQSFNQVQRCKISKLELEEGYRDQEGNGVSVTKIAFVIDEKSCKASLNTIDCGITITKGAGVKLKENFKPRMTFSAF